MAVLPNSRGSLRLSLDLAAFESQAQLRRSQLAEAPESVKIGLPVLGAGTVNPRVLAAISMDFFDRKDDQFWPFVRQAILWLGPSDPTDLIEGLARLVRDEVPGFAFRSGGGELVVQVGKTGDASVTDSVYAVEVGLDLATVLDEAAGRGNEPGEALSLFRFSTGRPQVVAFGQALRDELTALRAG